MVRYEHMGMWGQNEGSLYQTAMENMRIEGKPEFEDMETVMERILPETTGLWERKEGCGPVGMYVLTNCRRCYGASEILDRDTLHMIAEQIGDGFIALPSSVHETIVLPSKGEAEYERLARMVKEINKDQVAMEECLSDHIYLYDRKEGTLRIAA